MQAEGRRLRDQDAVVRAPRAFHDGAGAARRAVYHRQPIVARSLKRGGYDRHARGLAQLKLASHDADAVALAAFDRARLSPGLAHRPIGADVGADAAGVADLGKKHRRALHEHQGVKAAALDAFAAAAALFTVEFRHFPLYHAAREIFRAEKQAAVRLLDVAVNIGGAPRSAG